MKKHLLAIINPISGTRSKEDLPELIRETLDNDRFEIDIIYTRYAGHGAELTRQAVAEQIDCVIAIGGDGTCNEVARELIGSSTALGIVPIGSGNGLARHLGIPMNPRKALQIINEQCVVDLDCCTANNRPFFCTCGVGFDALVSLKFAQGTKRGKLSYVRKALAEYLKYHSENYRIEMPNGDICEQAFLIACGNASQYGNNAYIAPHASMQDGKIDVTLLAPITPIDAPLLALLLFTRHIDEDENIRYFSTESLTIIREKEGPMHIDGEPIEMEARIEIRCIPGAFKALIPAHAPKASFFAPIENHFWTTIDTVRHELNI